MENIIEDIAPVLFNALTGNEVTAAIDAAKGIADIFGWSDKDPSIIHSKLTGVTKITDDQRLSILKLNQQFAARQFKIRTDDVANARKYSYRHIVADAIAIVTFFVYIINLICPEYLNISPDKLNYFYVIMGTIVVYYFGAGELPLSNALRYLNETQDK